MKRTGPPPGPVAPSHELGLDPPASCRLSFYLYNNGEDVDRALAALADVVQTRNRSEVAVHDGR